MARVDRAGLEQFRAELTALALKGAQAGAAELREQLSQEGLGRKHPNLPNRSSTPQEYPSLQSGELRDSIAAREAGEMKAEFGPIDNPPDHVGDLHFKDPKSGGRPFLDMALYDLDIAEAICDAVEGEAGRTLGPARLRRGT